MFKFNNNWFKSGVALIILAILNPFFIMCISNTEFTVAQIDKLGTIGDFFGGTTVGLLSLASIFFVIHTIGIQRNELELTRKEFETGNTTAKVQQIDNAFFNMLSLHHEIVNTIEADINNERFFGRKAFCELKSKFEFDYAANISLLENIKHDSLELNRLPTQEEYIQKIFKGTETIDQKNLDTVYKRFHNQYGNDIGHYMRFNYRIVKFIVENVVADKEEQEKIKTATRRDTVIGDRKYYFGMLRAQWSNAEFELILINSLYSDNHKFKKLILTHDVLDILDIEDAQKNIDYFKLKDNTERFQPYKNLIEVTRSPFTSN